MSNLRRRATLAFAVGALASLVAAGAARAEVPVKLIESAHLSGPGSAPGQLKSPRSIATAPNGDLYVSDRGNNRIQELTPTGEFVLMFGKDVNKKGGNICTRAEANECQAGVEGSEAGAFSTTQSIAVDPSTGNVYVVDLPLWRVDEYTAGGEFVLMIGKGVNKKGGNVCTKAEASECQAGTQSATGSTEHGAFKFIQFDGNLLAVDSKGILYVGDEQRVQEFDASGKYTGVISLTGVSAEPYSRVTALVVGSSGDVYLAYAGAQLPQNIIRVFAPVTDEEVGQIVVPPRIAGGYIEIGQLALDSLGHLAVSALEHKGLESSVGTMFKVNSGQVMTRFKPPAKGTENIAFGNGNELYAVAGEELLVYEEKKVADLVSTKAQCSEGTPPAEDVTDVLLKCSLSGEVNPEGVSETEVWFEWGGSRALGQSTAPVAICGFSGQSGPVGEACGEATEPVGAEIATVVPGEGEFFYVLRGHDALVQLPEEALSSEMEVFKTPLVTPRTVGSPHASFVKFSSALLMGEINPENATTKYYFEYGECKKKKHEGLENCTAPVLASVPLESKEYGHIGVLREVTLLQPKTTYDYRVVAENAAGQALGEEGEFTTAPAPQVSATTGPASSVTSTSAVVSGTVAPDGQAATYRFELGVGSGSEYGVIASGSVAATSGQVGESLVLAGLQPGTTYSYRIAIASGFASAYGDTIIFQTQPAPTAIGIPVAVQQLSIPPFVFPQQPRTPEPLTNAQKLAKALKACAKKRKKQQRAHCIAAARRKYGPKKTKQK